MEFWSALTAIQKTYFVIGLAASVFLVLQIITLLFGFGDGGEVDVDFDGDGASDVTVDASDGFTLFSVRGIVAFFAIGGVSGAAGAYLMAQCVEEENEFEEYCDGDCENCAEFEECTALEECECDCEDCEECEEAEAEEEVDFELDSGEPFSRVAEAKDID